MHLVSFERDLNSLKLALLHPAWFRHLRHPAPQRLLADDRWRSGTGRIEWSLLQGDFMAMKGSAELPDVIFFDPFSFKTDAAMWGVAAFRELATLIDGRPVELFTYSCSTRVRAAMLAAGFYVATGRSTGPRAETTIGLSPAAAAGAHGRQLLDRAWLDKWHRSEARVPLGSQAGDASWAEAIREHPQFRG
ncbi:MAG: MnmC family methyltransferase, partial [Pseudomonadota bacterium]|nr:MnmC family methyltransferase [Pseudomonadota bacterium]